MVRVRRVFLRNASFIFFLAVFDFTRFAHTVSSVCTTNRNHVQSGRPFYCQRHGTVDGMREDVSTVSPPRLLPINTIFSREKRTTAASYLIHTYKYRRRCPARCANTVVFIRSTEFVAFFYKRVNAFYID